MTETETKPTEAGEAAVGPALQAIRDRSYSGRHPELGKMIKCQICGLRHREYDRLCEQTFAKNEDTEVEMRAPETRNGVIGAPRRINYAKPRFNPHKHPTKPTHMWLRKIMEKRNGNGTTVRQDIQAS